MIGRCYVLSEGLQVADELDGGEWKFCQGREQGHERFGYCQQGIATGFTADRHYILFGAPGTYNWKGEPLLSTKNIKSGRPNPHLGKQRSHAMPPFEAANILPQTNVCGYHSCPHQLVSKSGNTSS